ncbi:ABATE domain-containing protein [Pseudomonas sp. RC10]|uniref:CGNR zinc finger domain-containing protein n=1 Tax=Pseudomonas bambusae TaxID=3139142 RepID=UPI00313921B1
MSDSLRGPAMFVADAPALDFLNSVASPGGRHVDWLEDGAGWVDWLAQTGWVEPKVLAHIQARAMPGELDTIAAQARTLRDWFRDFVSKYRGQPLGAEAFGDLTALNRLLERDDQFMQVSLAPEATQPFQAQLVRRWPTPNALLLPVAEILANFICSEDFTDIKHCEGAACTLTFVDHTRGKKRRWCSMAVCGNRAKAAAHRERKKGTTSE